MSDNEQGGGAAAQALGEAIGGEGTVAIISGVPGATTDIARVDGFTQVIEENFPNVTLLEPEYSRSVVATAESQVQSLMLAHDDVAGVFAVRSAAGAGRYRAGGATRGTAGRRRCTPTAHSTRSAIHPPAHATAAAYAMPADTS